MIWPTCGARSRSARPRSWPTVGRRAGRAWPSTWASTGLAWPGNARPDPLAHLPDPSWIGHDHAHGRVQALRRIWAGRCPGPNCQTHRQHLADLRRALDMLTDDEVRRPPAAWIRTGLTTCPGPGHELTEGIRAWSSPGRSTRWTCTIPIGSRSAGVRAGRVPVPPVHGACAQEPDRGRDQLLFKGRSGARSRSCAGRVHGRGRGSADLGGFLILVVNRPGRAPVRVPVPLHVEVKVRVGPRTNTRPRAGKRSCARHLRDPGR